MAKTKKMKKETIIHRLKKMTDRRDEIIRKGVEKYHVRLMKGNDKTGINCYTVSLIPIADCPNCSGCAFGGCYDIQNVCWQPCVQEQRAINSAIHKMDKDRYWKEIDLQVKALFINELRINVGGDLDDEDFVYIFYLGQRNPTCHFLFFTKNYNGINKYFSNNLYLINTEYGRESWENIHPIMSPWIGMEFNNPYNLPCAHVLWADGRTTAPDHKAKYCAGNCSECFYHYKSNNKESSGCWGLGNGEHVIFLAH